MINIFRNFPYHIGLELLCGLKKSQVRQMMKIYHFYVSQDIESLMDFGPGSA